MNTEQKLGIKVFYYYLSKRVIVGLLLLIVSFIFTSFKAVIIPKIAFLLPMSIAIGIANYLTIGLFIVSFLFILGGFFMSWLNYISCTFTLGEQSFNIKRGILNKREVFIPYRQIQDISIEQTFYNKMMGISKLVILTAADDNNDTEGESEGVFEVIDSNLAQKIQKELLEKTNVQTTREIKN